MRETLLITGATGLIGSAVAELARRRGRPVRALVRRGADAGVVGWLRERGVDCVAGDLSDAQSLARAVHGVWGIVHCAAQVGEWGDEAAYRRLNIDALRSLLAAVERDGGVERFVLMSSLGVYAPRDHFGSDESVAIEPSGLDPYTRTKAEAERLVCEAMAAGRIAGTVLRPGFVYGPRDRHLLPRLVASLRADRFAYFGDGTSKLDNTGVDNIAHATMLALDVPAALGGVFNVTDDPLVTRRQFVETVARCAGVAPPQRHIPKRLARALAWSVDRGARLAGRASPPLLTMARYKFLALNLEYSIERAKTVLGYRPVRSFDDGMQAAMAWLIAGEAAA
jgi:nucleoside-diphosphate-sugar epimerase